MSLLVIGLSHHTAPLSVLENLSRRESRATDIATDVLASATASEVVVLSTCNRLEVYAEVAAFHPAVAAIGEALAVAAGSVTRGDVLDPVLADTSPTDPRAELVLNAAGLADHLYVRFDDNAIAHAFTVACGLDSMAVGEAQIIGQVRDALAVAQATGSAGESLNSLFQQALRIGKRAHAETDLDQHSVSLVQMALSRAAEVLGPLDQQHTAVVGAGGMSGLAAAAASRSEVSTLTVVGRTPERAERLAVATGGVTRAWADLADVIADSDVVITCTGAVGHIIDRADLARSAARRGGRPQVVVDLALPRDIEPPETWPEPVEGLTVIDLQGLGAALAAHPDSAVVAHVRAMIVGEVAAYLTRRVEKQVGPTVAALRARAATLVATEMARLDQRVPDLDDTTRAEVGLAVHRIVEKLLHTPTVRVKEFALEEGGDGYATALRELFDLEPREVANVSAPPHRGTA
ncbi:glutamyl-tRNA reductase [Humibacillus sp. DSM 29435]|uniref:glutamyl-tRNA reductase n=1 Tax=Humibacillus sp. DSM 29435 TaxID=1869167 RepID=UPI0008721E31|nr:glutamyl-tRNA reductase [Humibacillus sp. DSM 29435]OFE14921.1 glutamyl-tRNA reductase [Humibacillus sp. DSM 29435]